MRCQNYGNLMKEEKVFKKIKIKTGVLEKKKFRNGWVSD